MYHVMIDESKRKIRYAIISTVRNFILIYIFIKKYYSYKEFFYYRLLIIAFLIVALSACRVSLNVTNFFSKGERCHKIVFRYPF